MAKIMTLRVKVYTIAELKEANPRGFEKAMERLQQSEWEDSSFFSECIHDELVEYAKEQGYEIDGGRGRRNSLEWDSGRADYCAWSGSVYLEVVLPRYCAAEKIPPATRAMLLAMQKRAALSAYVKLRSSYMRDIMELMVDYDEGDTSDDDPRTIERREAAVAKFTEWLEEDLNDTANAMLKLIHDEEDYRSSEAYLMEEAEANERVFTIDGDDTVWVGSIPEEETT